jgi:hypothetical protein
MMKKKKNSKEKLIIFLTFFQCFIRLVLYSNDKVTFAITLGRRKMSENFPFGWREALEIAWDGVGKKFSILLLNRKLKTKLR